MPFDPGATARAALDLRPGWVRRWSATWQVAGKEVVVPVCDLASAPLAVCEPVRRFSWYPKQRHRPGLQFMVSTGRHHGFESLAEQRLLLALDFAGAALVVSQPFCLDTDTWQQLTSRLPPTPGPFRPDLGDHKRQVASMVVWARITQGEHLFAPRPIDEQQTPDVRHAWKFQRHTTWSHFQTARPKPHYADLKRLLDAYADQLAARIDGGLSGSTNLADGQS